MLFSFAFSACFARDKKSFSQRAQRAQSFLNKAFFLCVLSVLCEKQNRFKVSRKERKGRKVFK